MITLAAAGCALAFLVAVLALGALSSRSGICSVYAYSTCSALMTFAYGTIGAAFILIGLLVTFEFKYESFALINDCRGLHISNSDATDPTAACTADAVCDVVAYLKLRMQTLGFGLGVPFFLCGFMMFISCWFCCCCKSAFIVDSPEEVDFRDDIKADMLLPNGKGEVPKSSPEPLITERRSDLLEKNENVTDDDLSLSLKPTVAEFNDDLLDKELWSPFRFAHTPQHLLYYQNLQHLQQAHLQTHAPGGEAGMKNSGSPPPAMSRSVLRLLQQSSKSNLFKPEDGSG